jgi:hypothetical protein
MGTARIFGCPIVTSPQFLIASAALRRGSRCGARLLRPRSQTKGVSARSLVQDSGAPAWLSTAERDPRLHRPVKRAIGRRSQPTYDVVTRREKPLSPAGRIVCTLVIKDDPQRRSEGVGSALVIRNDPLQPALHRPGGIDPSSWRERAKSRPRVTASRNAYASRGSVGL